MPTESYQKNEERLRKKARKGKGCENGPKPYKKTPSVSTCTTQKFLYK